MNRILRSTLEIAGGGTVLVLAVVWLSGGCGERIGPDGVVTRHVAAGPAGGAAAVTSAEREVFVPASGTISSSRHTTVASKILARIDAIPVTAGDVVKEGDLLVALDSRDLKARVDAAREQVKAARAALELARSELERIAGLEARNVASRQQLDRARRDHDVAVAELERAQQQMTDAEVGLSYGRILSPVSGRVVDRLAQAGDTASPGQALVRIYDPGAMRLEAPIRERLATRLAPGQPVRVQIEALDLELQGEIDEIVAAAEPGARTFLVKVRLPRDLRLYAGMFGRVLVPAGHARVLSIPDAAIERIGQLAFVTVIGDDGAHHRRLVTTGPDQGDGRIEVLSGLAAGERVMIP